MPKERMHLAPLLNGCLANLFAQGVRLDDGVPRHPRGGGRLSVKNAVIDGEVVAIGKGGKPDFQELRRGLDNKSAPFRYYAFDLLVLDGEDLRERPLLERKRRLRSLLHEAPDRLVYVEHRRGDSRRIVHHACELGLEGIVSKQAHLQFTRARTVSLCHQAEA